MKEVTIPVGDAFDEGKRGPWIKLTWEEADALIACLQSGAINLTVHTFDELDALMGILAQLKEQREYGP